MPVILNFACYKNGNFRINFFLLQKTFLSDFQDTVPFTTTTHIIPFLKACSCNAYPVQIMVNFFAHISVSARTTKVKQNRNSQIKCFQKQNRNENNITSGALYIRIPDVIQKHSYLFTLVIAVRQVISFRYTNI